MKKISKKFILLICAVVIAFASIPLSSVSNSYAVDANKAVKCDQDFYSNNDILFYNPCSTSCSDAPNGPAADVTSVHGANNGEKIFNFWIDAGLTPQQAAGITGSMQNEGGFSAFRQQDGSTWPSGGWGIAQFDSSGQRAAVLAFLNNAIGADLVAQYYKVDYGGRVTEASGFVPTGVPVDVNDKFLLGELNYLLEHIQQLVPNVIRTSSLTADFKQTIPTGETLYTYMKTLVQADDAAIAWTYLYEFPGERIEASKVRVTSAATILQKYSDTTTKSCGGNLAAGGMTLEQGINFMNEYKNTPSNVQYIAGAGQDCPGGPLSNCVSFSVYFVRKYTDYKESGAAGNGSTVVAHLLGLNPTAANGHVPRPYAIFSTPSGSQMCGDVKCGHTGVILGVDVANGLVVVGEAACGSPASWDTARVYPLSKFSSGAYTYLYTDGHLKGDVQ
jgi:hypothetical protein